MKKLALMVTTAPSANLTVTAINYIKAALRLDISIVGVFFYQDGVLNASKHLNMPNDEYQTSAQWLQLASEFSVPLHVCISACEKRGLTDDIAAEGTCSSNISNEFIVSGLGEMVELTMKADRVVQL